MDQPEISVEPHTVLRDNKVISIRFPGYHVVAIYSRCDLDGKPIVRVVHHDDVRIDDVVMH